MKNDRPNYVSVTQPVRVRRYDVDTDGLRKTLKNHKTKSISEIANELGVSETMVQHWFRNDECFSIPQPEIWPRLKAVLGIEADEFDDPIMTFDERDGVFEKGERIYLTNGVSPTLTAQTNGERIIELNSVEVLGLLDEDGYELSNRVYNQDGLAPSIRTYQGGGLQPKFVEVKQATSDGSISCMVGGGGGLELSNEQNKARKSTRRWNGLPNSDNGEYP